MAVIEVQLLSRMTTPLSYNAVLYFQIYLRAPIRRVLFYACAGKRRRAPHYLKNAKELEDLVDTILGPGPTTPIGGPEHGNGVRYNGQKIMDGTLQEPAVRNATIPVKRAKEIPAPVESPSPNAPPPGVTPPPVAQ